MCYAKCGQHLQSLQSFFRVFKTLSRMCFSILNKKIYKSHGVPVEVGHNDGDRQCDTKNLVRMKSYFFFQSLFNLF